MRKKENNMRVLDIVRNAPKRATALIAVAAAVVTVPAALLAWGPDRPTFTVENPASYVTFNSITNNRDYGDERNFVRIKDAANTQAGGWSDNITVQPGKEYLVQMYVHNNAATSLNASGAGIAKNVNVMASVPNTTGKSVEVNGFITADNAQPKQVWDQAKFNSTNDFNIAYVGGSATYYNNVYPQGTKLPDSIVTSSGAKLGYDKMNGDLPGCFQYSGYVSFKVKAQVAETPDFTVKKEVSKHGANKWVESYAAQPGETVDYLVEYRNTGSVQQDNVVVKDALPKSMTYVAGSTLYGTKANPAGAKASDNVTTTGINIGSYAKNSGTWVMFSAKLASKDQLECGHQKLRNIASVQTDYGTKHDDAYVTVDGKECKPEDKYKQVCDIKTKQIITINEKAYDASKHAPVDSPLCKEQPKMVKVCNPVTGEIIPVDEKDAGKYAPIGSDKCKEMEVCVIKTKETKIIKKSAFDSSIYTTDFSKCKDVPVTPPTPETPKTPETPAELPETGMADVVAQLAGLFALTASGAYYLNSRRQA